MNKIFPILLFLVVASTWVQAQERQWTLDDCIRYAVENSPKINKQNAQNAIYQQDYMSAIGRLLPSLSVNTNAYFNFGRGIDYDTNTYIDINSFSNAYSLYSSLTLFDGLSNIYRVRMQKASKLAGKQQLEQEREMVAYDTMESFFNVLYYKRMVQLAEEQAEESANNMKQAKRMEELGMKAKPDVAEMAAKEAADIYNLTRQKNLLTIGIILLKERMNFPIEDELDITDEQSDVLIVKSGETVSAIYETARVINPRALSAESALKVQQMNKRVAMGGFSPVISMEAGISSGFARYLNGSDYEPFWDQLKNKRGSYVGFTLSVPLFTGFSKTTNYKRSKAQVIIAESEFQETLRTLYSEIEQSVADMNGQADAYRQAVKQREAMETAHEANQRKYEEGLISPLELHTSANRVVEAKAEEMNAELQYRLKARLVRYYNGESFVEGGK
ncbi:TolC family protein [Proteiniphilum sp.]|uniref:TolC family protein n=1 Tax=Proteiniphilum sp. TaxID=1926877 RepID=UPI003333E095